MEILIISGLSGAGKSQTVSFLEDMDFYIVDNMPVAMIVQFAEFCTGASSRRYERVALVYDVRTSGSFNELFEALDRLKAMNCLCRMLFLEASPETVLKRYKETRRRHPLHTEGGSLETAVYQEREIMAPVRERADFIINTSAMPTAKLRQQLLSLFCETGEKGGITIYVVSFGFKYGLPMEADLVFDVRFMPNPFYIAELRPQTGLDAPVSDYVFSFQQTKDYVALLRQLVNFTLPLYAEEGKSSLTIAVGCTGGHHRSVAVAHDLADFIQAQGYHVEESHRDIERGT